MFSVVVSAGRGRECTYTQYEEPQVVLPDAKKCLVLVRIYALQIFWMVSEHPYYVFNLFRDVILAGVGMLSVC